MIRPTASACHRNILSALCKLRTPSLSYTLSSIPLSSRSLLKLPSLPNGRPPAGVMAPLPVPSFGRVNGFAFEATVGELVPLLELLLPEVKKLAYLEMAAAACCVVDEVPVVADDVDS